MALEPEMKESRKKLKEMRKQLKQLDQEERNGSTNTGSPVNLQTSPGLCQDEQYILNNWNKI
jgi:hypothetical protein